MSGSVVGMLNSILSADSCVLTAEMLRIAAAGLSAGHAQERCEKADYVPHPGKRPHAMVR